MGERWLSMKCDWRVVGAGVKTDAFLGSDYGSSAFTTVPMFRSEERS